MDFTINWYSSSVPIASGKFIFHYYDLMMIGKLYLFNSEYSGTFEDLATSVHLGVGVSVNGNYWQFRNVEIQASTQYYYYADSFTQTNANADTTQSDYPMYISSGANYPFGPFTSYPLAILVQQTESLTTRPLTSGSMTTQELTTQELTTQELTTQDLTTQELTTQELTTQELTTQELTTQELTTQDLTTQELTTQELTTQELTTQELTTQELTTQEMTSGFDEGITTSPLTTAFSLTASSFVASPGQLYYYVPPTTNPQVPTDILYYGGRFTTNGEAFLSENNLLL